MKRIARSRLRSFFNLQFSEVSQTLNHRIFNDCLPDNSSESINLIEQEHYETDNRLENSRGNDGGGGGGVRRLISNSIGTTEGEGACAAKAPPLIRSGGSNS